MHADELRAAVNAVAAPCRRGALEPRPHPVDRVPRLRREAGPRVRRGDGRDPGGRGLRRRPPDRAPRRRPPGGVRGGRRSRRRADDPALRAPRHPTRGTARRVDEPAVRTGGARRASVRARDVRRQVRHHHACRLAEGLGREAARVAEGAGRGRGGGERRAPPVPDRRAQGAPDGRRDRRGRRRELAGRHPDARDEHPWRRRLHRHGPRARPGLPQRGLRRTGDRRDLGARADPVHAARRRRDCRDRGSDARAVGGTAAHRGGVPGGDPAATECQPGGLGIDLGAAVVQTGRGRARPGRPARDRGLEPARSRSPRPR